MTLPEFLTDQYDNEIRLKGHRISLYSVIDRYLDGYSPEMLAEEYPTLSLSLIHRAIAFYLDNQVELDRYVAEYRAELERQEVGQVPSPATERIRKQIALRRLAEGAKRLGA